jgi:ornithine cyclodeaminase/alanine dehydrogenase
VGCGAQARSQVRALVAVRPLERLWVCDRASARAEAFASEMATELGIPVEATVDLESAVERSDVCITCTTARAPMIRSGMVPAGMFLAAVGADNPEKQEIEPAVMAAARVVVDSLEQCLSIGDLHHAVVAGSMRPDDVHAALGAIVAGLAPGRTTADEVFVFDSTGTALQDVACAGLVFERAVAAGRGSRAELAPA